MGFNLPVLNRRRRLLGTATPIFSPSTLFALAEPGVWYDPSDVANLAWRRNLLTFTEQFDNAAWTKESLAVTANADTAPNGTMTADLFTGGVGTTAKTAYVVSVSLSSAVYTWTVYAKYQNNRWIALNAYSGTNNFTFFDVQNGVVGTVGSGATATISPPDANGWRRCSVTRTATATASGGIGLNLAPSDNATTFPTSTGGQTVLIWGAQLELGSVATDYQRISDVNTEVIERFPSATLYQDPAGTLPVTSPAQTVGLALDKSKGLVLGSELVTNGDFSSGTTGYTNQSTGTGTFTVSGGVATVSGTDSSNRGVVRQTLSGLAVGRTYLFAWNSTGAGGFGITTTSTGTVIDVLSLSAGGNGANYFVATATTLYFVARSNNTGSTATIDNISVRELPGNHATQATLASRPTYGIVPLGGRRNLLTWSEDFRTTAQAGETRPWLSAGGTITADQGSAPNGTITADRMTTIATGSVVKGIYASLSLAAGTHTFSACVKDNSSTARSVNLFFSTPGFAATLGLTYNFDTDVLTNDASAAPFTFVASSRTLVGSGWVRLSIAVTVASAQTVQLYIAAPFAPAQAGNFLIWGAQLETGSSATAYQRVGSAFDVTEAGVASLSYLSFDGVDDFMITPTITPGIDKAQVFAGVRKLSDAAAGIVVESSATVASNAGSFYLTAPEDTTTVRYSSLSRGSLSPLVGMVASLTTGAAPDTSVITATHDIAGDLSTIRRNGVAGTNGTADKGTGNFLAYPLYIGMRAGTSLPFNGNLFSLIVRFGTNLDAGTITSTETWVNGKTGAYT